MKARLSNASFELERIDFDIEGRIDPFDAQLAERRDGALDQVLHAAHQFDEPHRIEVDALLARKGEQLPRQQTPALDGIERTRAPADHAVDIVGLAGDQFEIARHRLKQIVEIMRDAAGELADRLELLRLEKCRFELQPLRHVLAQILERGVAFLDQGFQFGVLIGELRARRHRNHLGQ